MRSKAVRFEGDQPNVRHRGNRSVQVPLVWQREKKPNTSRRLKEAARKGFRHPGPLLWGKDISINHQRLEQGNKARAVPVSPVKAFGRGHGGEPFQRKGFPRFFPLYFRMDGNDGILMPKLAALGAPEPAPGTINFQ